MPARIHPLHVYSAAGNRFALVDGLAGDLPEDPAKLARSLCAKEWAEPRGFRPDGLLMLVPPRGGGAFGMVLHNADGSRPEMCGNGLRVIGDHAMRAGHADTGMIWIETDAGLRRLALARGAGGEPRVRALVAHPRIVARDVALALAGGERRATVIDAGNPHCVIFGGDPEREDLDAIGSALQRHERFPAGVNVELVHARDHGLAMRVYERGVGETLSCGTGACAAAFAALAGSIVERGPISITCRGGDLLVERDEEGGAWLSGPLDLLSGSPSGS
jgi:diaminopimelate epimerase